MSSFQNEDQHEKKANKAALVIEVEQLSYVVRSQKFKITATAMKRSAIPLATEYAVRLVHLAPDIGPEELATFFGFGPAEVQVLVQDMLETQLVSERDGKFTLSAKGRDAISPLSDDIELFAVDEINAIQCFDLIAFAPVDEADLNASEARLIPEIEIPNRERAATAASAAKEAFETHFSEWYQRNDRRRRIEDIRLHTVDDVQPLKTFGAPLHFPVRYRLEDPSAIEPDFSFLRNKGRPSSRNALIEALSKSIQAIVAPSDHEKGFYWLDGMDSGLFRRAGLRNSHDQAAWARLCADSSTRSFETSNAVNVRLFGSTTATLTRAALLQFTKTVATDRAELPTPIFWLPPQANYWGRSVAFTTLAREMASADPDGLVLLARTDGLRRSASSWKRNFGPREGRAPLFSRCLAIRTDTPDSVEIVLKPGAWALALVHTPEPSTGFPIPMGIISSDPYVALAVRQAVAEVVASADGSKAVLWSHGKESPETALAYIDLALGIEEA